ncbi:UNVERIFIED_CONTAM: hypothetical protein Sradi_5715300 [Sesamum radiatum]|uniref:Uncharacterized protein n=1 Tax=Sesamum radiatum TaxID=300843 RepID=A0AAW2L1N6_SESRA
MIEDASAQAASRAVAQYVAEHAFPPQPPRQPGRGRGAGLAPENNERGRAGQQARDQLEEEVESRPSLPEDELPPLPREAPPEEERSQRRARAAARQASIGGADNIQVFPWPWRLPGVAPSQLIF